MSLKKRVRKNVIMGLLGITIVSSIPININAYENVNEENQNSIMFKNEAVDNFDYFYDDAYVSDFIMNIAQELRNLKDNGATDEELDLYTENALSKIPVRYDLTDYINGKLNAQEQKLYNSSKSKGLLCMANGKMAINYAEKYYKSSVLHNGNGDAFRHTIWNYGMVIDVGHDFAKKWSDAHENGATNQPSIEKSMDLHNNSIGLSLGKSYPNTISHSTFINKSKEKVNNGSCRRISNGKLVATNSTGQK